MSNEQFKLQKVKTENLKPYDNNPKRHPEEQIELIKKSIEENDYRFVIHVDENFEIIAGHARLKALKELGREEVHVMVHENLTDGQKRQLRLADNKMAELSEWDYEKLDIEMRSLDASGDKLELTGFEQHEIEAIAGDIGMVMHDNLGGSTSGGHDPTENIMINIRDYTINSRDPEVNAELRHLLEKAQIAPNKQQERLRDLIIDAVVDAFNAVLH